MTTTLSILIILFALVYLGRRRPEELRHVAGRLHGLVRDALTSLADALGNGARFLLSSVAGPLFWLDPRVTGLERAERHTAGRAVGRVLVHVTLAAFGLLAVYADYIIQTLSIAAITAEPTRVGHLGLGVAGWTALTWVGSIGFFGALAFDMVGITPGDVFGFERRDERGGRPYRIVLGLVLVILGSALLAAPLAAWLRVDMLGGSPGAQGVLGHYVMTVVSTLPALVTAVALVIVLFLLVMSLALPPALVGVACRTLEAGTRLVVAALTYLRDATSTVWSLVDGIRDGSAQTTMPGRAAGAASASGGGAVPAAAVSGGSASAAGRRDAEASGGRFPPGAGS